MPHFWIAIRPRKYSALTQVVSAVRRILEEVVREAIINAVGNKIMVTDLTVQIQATIAVIIVPGIEQEILIRVLT